MIYQFEATTSRLRDIFAHEYDTWKVSSLDLIGNGLEFLVYRAESSLHGSLAIRTPRERWISNDNDAHVDARELLRQEALLTSHFFSLGLPVPQFYTLHTGEELDFLVTAYIENDQTQPDSFAFGQLMWRIHNSPIPDFAPVMLFNKTLAYIIAERVIRRLNVVEQLGDILLPSFSQQTIESILQRFSGRSSILHMDARPANLLTRQSAIAAIVDWSNALIGDPALEIARIAEAGNVNEAFLAGYEAREKLVAVPVEVELIYRLDTAAMLAVVFLSEAPDPELATTQVARVVQLCSELSFVL